MNACGRRTIARPSATRWRSPPERPDDRAIEQRLDPQNAGRPPRRARLDLARLARPRISAERRCSGARSCAGRARKAGRRRRCRAAAARLNVTSSPVEQDATRGRQFQPRDHAQRRRLAAARRTEQTEELAVLDDEVRVLAPRRSRRKALCRFSNPNLRHGPAPNCGNLRDDDEHRAMPVRIVTKE